MAITKLAFISAGSIMGLGKEVKFITNFSRGGERNESFTHDCLDPGNSRRP